MIFGCSIDWGSRHYYVQYGFGWADTNRKPIENDKYPPPPPPPSPIKNNNNNLKRSDPLQSLVICILRNTLWWNFWSPGGQQLRFWLTQCYLDLPWAPYPRYMCSCNSSQYTCFFLSNFLKFIFFHGHTLLLHLSYMFYID